MILAAGKLPVELGAPRRYSWKADRFCMLPEEHADVRHPLFLSKLRTTGDKRPPLGRLRFGAIVNVSQ